MIQILNSYFNTKIEWTEEEVLRILKKANSKKDEKELISLIKQSNLVKYVPKSTSKSKNSKKQTKTNDRNADDFQTGTDSQ